MNINITKLDVTKVFTQGRKIYHKINTNNIYQIHWINSIFKGCFTQEPAVYLSFSENIRQECADIKFE